MRDLYVILGVGENASVSDVRKAYRKLARKYHPHINPGNKVAAERYSGIIEAYEVLCDAEKRSFYDTHGYYDERAIAKRDQPRLGFSFQGFEPSGADKPRFSDLFDDFFAEIRSRQQPEVSNDIEAQVSLTFGESIHGIQTTVSVYRRRTCGECRGFGRATDSADFQCPGCGGSGELVRSRGHLRFAMTCPECDGNGRVAPACQSCRGEGQLACSEQVQVDVPAGVSSGSRVRYSGWGNTDAETGRSGDLIVVTNVAEDSFFKRAGDNIRCTVPISVTEAALGARIVVPSIDGAVTLKVPPGTQSGQTLRLRRKGAPSLRGDEVRGDQYIEIQVVTPRVVDERSKEILREFASLNPIDRERELTRGR